jgi:DNA modification methylase
MKLGDIVRVGTHVIGRGDARDADFVNRVIGSRKIKMVCCDVPYAIDMVAAKAGFSKIRVPKNILNDGFASDEDYAKFTKQWLLAVIPHLERKNGIYIFNSDKMIVPLIGGMRDAGLYFSQILLWLKNNAVVGRKDYLPQFEIIAYGWSGIHEFKKAQDKNILLCPKPSRSEYHPSQKPIPLIRRLILNATSIGDVVYDGFMGSGTACLAAESVKRSSVGIELDEEYCVTAIRRLAALGLPVQKL